VTTLIFLRHAHSVANKAGVLAGRLPNIELSAKGLRQAKKLVNVLDGIQIDRVFVSPISRCKDSIEPWLKKHRRRIQVDQAFQEMDYGDWSGLKLSELSKMNEWQLIQKSPEDFKFPGGESFKAAAKRVKLGMNQIANTYPDKTILVVSHGDIIKLAIAQTLDMKLNHFQRIVVDPASFTVIQWGAKQKTLMAANSRTLAGLIGNKQDASKKLTDRRILGGGSGE
jgi:probable phosphomutase (TIGR03848 family)